MKKPIFENEEEFNDFFRTCIMNNMERKEILESVKSHGYIRKSIVEEAGEIYVLWKDEYDNPKIDTSWSNTIAVVNKQHEAIQYLKKQLESK